MNLKIELPEAKWRADLDLAMREKANGLWFYDRNQSLIRVIKPHQKQIKEHSNLDKKVFPMALERVSPYFTQAMICLEDQGFYKHFGVPIKGVLRALWLNLKAGRLVAGGSGISQQTIKLFRGRARGIWSKFEEARYALALEKKYDKSDILELYINHVSFGPNITGIHAASNRYFSVDPHRLSLAQSAYLASLPLAPSRLNPYKSVERAMPRQRAALSCMYRQNLISSQQYQRALSEAVKLSGLPVQQHTAHLTESLAYHRLSQLYSPPQKTHHAQAITLSIDHHVQIQMETICRRYAQANAELGLRQLAAVGLDLESGEVLFWVGSQDYAHPDAGQVDHVLGLRLPGSTLKPFLYALALDRGFNLDHSLPDRALYFKTPRGQYKPKNYDHKHRGEVTLMSALATSLNIPSVFLLNQVGISEFLDTLRSVGLDSLNQDAEHYGLGLSLGDGEVRLIDLVNAYRIFGQKGKHSPWQLLKNVNLSWETTAGSHHKPQQSNPNTESEKQVISARAAQAILHTLSSRELRAPAFGYQSPLNLPFPSAAKTGTGQGYSNAWTIGLSSKYVVGVWVLPKFGAQLSGGMIAAPLWHKLMLALHEGTSLAPFAKDQLSIRDQQVLEQVIQLEKSRHQPHLVDHTASATDHDNTYASQDKLKSELSPQVSSYQNPHKIKFSIKILTPLNGSEYHYLHQRSPLDNHLKAEIQINDKHIAVKNLGKTYRIQWFLNRKPIKSSSGWAKSIWINPWVEHSLNQQLCVSIMHKINPQINSWSPVNSACSHFQVYPKNIAP